jgi:hypothetical protein
MKIKGTLGKYIFQNVELKGQELVDYLMQRWNMTEDEALQNLSENIGNVKLEIGKDSIPFPFNFNN